MNILDSGCATSHDIWTQLYKLERTTDQPYTTSCSSRKTVTFWPLSKKSFDLKICGANKANMVSLNSWLLDQMFEVESRSFTYNSIKLSPFNWRCSLTTKLPRSLLTCKTNLRCTVSNKWTNFFFDLTTHLIFPINKRAVPFTRWFLLGRDCLDLFYYTFNKMFNDDKST